MNDTLIFIIIALLGFCIILIGCFALYFITSSIKLQNTESHYRRLIIQLEEQVFIITEKYTNLQIKTFNSDRLRKRVEYDHSHTKLK